MYMKTYSESSTTQPFCFVREASLEDETSDQDTSFYLIYSSGTVHVKVSNYLETPKQIAIFVDQIIPNTQLLVVQNYRKICKEVELEEWMEEVFGRVMQSNIKLPSGDSMEKMVESLHAALDMN